MAQFRINPSMVCDELFKILNGVDINADEEGEEAKRQPTYIAGAMDMANAIIKRYEGGNTNA